MYEYFIPIILVIIVIIYLSMPMSDNCMSDNCISNCMSDNSIYFRPLYSMDPDSVIKRYDYKVPDKINKMDDLAIWIKNQSPNAVGFVVHYSFFNTKKPVRVVYAVIKLGKNKPDINLGLPLFLYK